MTVMIVPLAEDVMPALAQAAAETPHRPVNMGEIGWKIARAKGVLNRSDRDPCSPSTLRALLAELVDGGKLVAQRGAEWREQGVVFLNQRDDGWYYGRPDDVSRWLDTARRKADADRLADAKAQALTTLRDRHLDEYRQIVDELL